MTNLWRATTSSGERLMAAVAEAPDKTLMAFDFDGTLAAMQTDPEKSHLYPPTAEALARIGGRLGQLAIITGRGVKTVLRLGQLSGREGFEKALVFGAYGVEVWDATTNEFDLPPSPIAVRHAIDDLENMLADAHDDGFDTTGITLEDKQRAVGVHYRRSPDPDTAERWLQGPVAIIAERHGLELEPGRLIIELRASTTTKGDALRGLVDMVDPEVVIFFGDDLGDVPAFQASRAFGESLIAGNVVAASDEALDVLQYADVLCEGPAGIAAWLTELADLMDARAAGASS